jgi:hypothetical protein
MEYVTNLPRNLLFLAAIIAILVIGYKMIVYYAEHQPIYDPSVQGPQDQQDIAAVHVEKVGAKVIHPEQFRRVGELRDWELVRRHDVETERQLMARMRSMQEGDK